MWSFVLILRFSNQFSKLWCVHEVFIITKMSKRFDHQISKSYFLIFEEFSQHSFGILVKIYKIVVLKFQPMIIKPLAFFKLLLNCMEIFDPLICSFFEMNFKFRTVSNNNILQLYLELDLENGFVLCDKEPKNGKSCVWFCNRNYELEGIERAECVCNGPSCYWNDDANFQPPSCQKNPCLPNPCGAGDCDATGDDFECSCQLGYSGKRCELPDVSFSNNHLIADDSGISSFLTGRNDNELDEQGELLRRGGEKNRLMDLQNKHCPLLEPGPNGQLKCSNGNRAKSSCFLTCNDGFQVSNPKVSHFSNHFLACFYNWHIPIANLVLNPVRTTR